MQQPQTPQHQQQIQEIVTAPIQFRKRSSEQDSISKHIK
jgi:hypothetical protein